MNNEIGFTRFDIAMRNDTPTMRKHVLSIVCVTSDGVDSMDLESAR